MKLEPKCVGIASHPYALRALSRAVNQACDPSITKRHVDEVIAKSGVSYLLEAEVVCDDTHSLLNTHFDVDHTEIDAILAGMSDWNLGELLEAHEFVALFVAE